MDMDNDDDYCDLGEVIEEVEEEQSEAPRTNSNGLRIRGPDKAWVEIERFANATEFKNSDIFKKLKAEFSLRKSREYEYADVSQYECKFKRRVGYLPCLKEIKVNPYNMCIFKCFFKVNYFLQFSLSTLVMHHR